MKTGFTLWFTGLPCSGKTTLAVAAEEELVKLGHKTVLLDGDVTRKILSPDLGFTKVDRDTHVRRVSHLASALTAGGSATLVALVSPYRTIRLEARKLIAPFVEVYVSCSLSVCEERDVKGMYRLARSNKIAHFTGISDPYEPPLNPEITVRTDSMNVQASVEKILEYLKYRKLIMSKPARSYTH